MYNKYVYNLLYIISLMSNKYVQLHKIHSLSQCSIWNQVIVVYFTLNTKFQRTIAVPTPLPAVSLVSVSDSRSVVSDSLRPHGL